MPASMPRCYVPRVVDESRRAQATMRPPQQAARSH
jgi:hypothetical protein